ncbi:MAG: universal stress protein [Rhodoferax sp.]|uniref:universal stress protein n=1 Tax=Rhodoferax sp. TaxID=50421 RepID=UPI002ACED5CF|nr:universal stress protein [Rhodoferax sp.]MDZ7893269.1 universal stress protein [Rhodoferax sp.]
MKVLLPVDGSELSMEAVHWVLAARVQGLPVEVVLVNVQEPANLYELVVAHDADVLSQVSTDAGMHCLEPARALLSAAGVECVCEVATGDPAHMAIEVGERHGVDLVVMGAESAGALGTGLVGSVANEVLRTSTVPVVIVKLPADDEGLSP